MGAQTIYGYDDYSQHKVYLSYFESSEGKMAYLDHGSGTEVILLVHGVPTSSWLYRKMINPLTEAGYRVIAPDMLGYGASDKGKNESQYHPDKHSDRIVQLMDHLKISHWTHVVHDAGGPWSWGLIKTAGSRVKNLIILNTILFESGFNPPIHLKRGTLKSNLIIAFYGTKFGSKVITNSTLNTGTKTCELTKVEKQGYRQALLEGANTAIGVFFTGFDEMLSSLPGVHEKIVENKPHILVIWGKHDKILQGEKQIPMMVEKLGVEKKNVHLLEDCDHFVQEDNPQKVVSIIVDFLKNR